MVALPLVPVVWVLWLLNFVTRVRQQAEYVAPQLPDLAGLSPSLGAEYSWLLDLWLMTIFVIPLWFLISLIWAVWTWPKWRIILLAWGWFIGCYALWYFFPSRDITQWFLD